MSTCGETGCDGHLGKFSSCRDEALYDMTCDGMAESTGSTEWEIHVSRIDLDAPKTVNVGDEKLGAVSVTISPGHYLILTNDQGFVWVEKYDSKEMADHRWNRIDSAYSTWLDSDSPDFY